MSSFSSLALCRRRKISRAWSLLSPEISHLGDSGIQGEAARSTAGDNTATIQKEFCGGE